MKKDYFGSNWKSMTFAYVKPKNGDYYAEFRIVYNNNVERDKAAHAVHELLCGEKSYINSDVVLNIDEDNVIVIIYTQFLFRTPLHGFPVTITGCCITTSQSCY